MPKDTVLIIEPDFSGHRWRYAEWAAQACLEAGYACVIATASANATHPLAQRLARPQVDGARAPDLQITFVDPPTQESRRGLGSISYVRFFRYFQHIFKTVSREHPVVRVIVPYVDYFLYALPALGSPFGKMPWVGITMRATFQHHEAGVVAPRRPLVNAVKAQLFRRALRTPGLRTLLSIDPTLGDWCEKNAAADSATVQYLPDPSPDTPAPDPLQARERLGLTLYGQYVLVYGAISERKGIYELVDALAARADAPTLVIAGSQDMDVRAPLKRRLAQLSTPPIVLDQFISGETESDLFAACDVVWLGYKGHYGMSGVLVQAYRAGKPLIATAEGLIGWFCRDGALGPVLDDLSVDAINQALDLALDSYDAYPRQSDAAGGHLLERNTLSHFKQTLQSALRDNAVLTAEECRQGAAA
ncbi:glycosyltransferase [Paraburkholderia sp. DHOC27]|uniref:glycosyltransferase n=1 Tax=Paraburkholderia sp. DHOC27 TaxID=2303330 RepID=UPI000E3E9106|nr:glycosyltransferase [Paraburkholderia sp. DHOC27]RFU48107.1 glycosyltransferase [Paraburkholderia sp. DHOC27]